jgi:hypothetical protein
MTKNKQYTELESSQQTDGPRVRLRNTTLPQYMRTRDVEVDEHILSCFKAYNEHPVSLSAGAGCVERQKKYDNGKLKLQQGHVEVR